MKARIVRGLAAASAVTAAAAAAVFGVAPSSAAQSYGPAMQAYGLANNGTILLSFQTDDPTVNDWVRAVRGLSGDTALIGIDFRVQDGQLYGVGNQGGIYTISIPGAVVTKVSQLSAALHGSFFGVDFNPAANRLRIISNTGQNLRHNIDDGATAGQTIIDPMLTNGSATATGVTGAAYTNNDLNADTVTTLYDIDTALDQVSIQAPANNGTLNPIGRMGVNAGTDAGFDIFSDLVNGKTNTVAGFAVLAPGGGRSAFYGVNLFTGAVTWIGDFPLPVTDAALALDPS